VKGIAEATVRLGYPIAEQHYFSGFVLRAEERAQWRDIDFAAAASAQRGTAQTYVWALPQVARDGYTHFQIGDESEDQVRAFDDVLFPTEIGREAEAITEFSTQVVTSLSGHERRNSDWADARMSYDVAPGVRSEEELAELARFFRARRGSAIGFRFADPFEDSSNDMLGPPTMTDQIIGVGDGVRTLFPLVKNYGQGVDVQSRPITRPRSGTMLVAVNGVATTDWTLGEKGTILFNDAPAAGTQITAGYRFDVPVRFADDRLELNRATFGAGAMPSVMLVEVKEV
jgi:uncharacterized protein (TIGR02217 family)